MLNKIIPVIGVGLAGALLMKKVKRVNVNKVDVSLAYFTAISDQARQFASDSYLKPLSDKDSYKTIYKKAVDQLEMLDPHAIKNMMVLATGAIDKVSLFEKFHKEQNDQKNFFNSDYFTASGVAERVELDVVDPTNYGPGSARLVILMPIFKRLDNDTKPNGAEYSFRGFVYYSSDVVVDKDTGESSEDKKLYWFRRGAYGSFDLRTTVPGNIAKKIDEVIRNPYSL